MTTHWQALRMKALHTILDLSHPSQLKISLLRPVFTEINNSNIAKYPTTIVNTHLKPKNMLNEICKFLRYSYRLAEM